jgi:hypothetical protein
VGPAAVAPRAGPRTHGRGDRARVEFPIDRVREIQRINQDTVSLEQPVGDEDDFSLSDLIEDRGAVVPDDAATRAMLDKAVREALAYLSHREQDVVRLRFGLEDGKIRTLEEVGKAFGVTRERVRQIESKTWPSSVDRTRRTFCVTTSRRPDRSLAGSDCLAGSRLVTSVGFLAIRGSSTAEQAAVNR